MWIVKIACSSCEEETEVVVENLEDAEREVCACGYSYIVLSVAEFQPLEPKRGELIELRRREDRALAA
jgi:hypothetical protein